MEIVNMNAATWGTQCSLTMQAGLLTQFDMDQVQYVFYVRLLHIEENCS